MKKILILANIILFLSGCAELIAQDTVNQHKSYYIGKKVAFTPSVSSFSEDASIYTISDVRYNHNYNSGRTSYFIDLDKNPQKYISAMSYEDVINHKLPSPLIYADSDEYKAMAERVSQLKKSEETRKETARKRNKSIYDKFKATCSECTELEITYNGVNCPLVFVPVSANCSNLTFKKADSSHIEINGTGCLKGDVDIVFSYGTKYATVQKMSIGDNSYYRNAFTANDMDAAIFNLCWIAANTIGK